MDFKLKVMLRSTTGLYDWGWGVGMMHRLCSTYSGQHQCGHSIYYFLIFNISKPMYMYNVLKIYI